MSNTRGKRAIVPSGSMSLAQMNAAGAVALVPVDGEGRLVEGAGAVDLTEGDPRDDEAVEEPQSSADRVMEMLADVAGDERAKIMIYRVAIGGKNVFCDELAPEEFEAGGIKLIRDRFGDGEFIVKLYGTIPGTSRFAIRARSNVTIDKPRGLAPTPHQAQDSGMADALHQLAENQARMLDAITNRPAADPMAEMTKMLAMMTAMRTAMGLDTKTAPKSSIAEMVDAIRELKAANGLIEGKDDDESLTGMVKSMLPVIVEVMGKSRQPNPGPFPAIMPPGSIATATPPSTDTTPAQSPQIATEGHDMGMDEQLAAIALKGYLAALLILAQKNADPMEGANLIVDKLPDEIVDLMELETWFEMLLQIAPQVAPYREWMTKARDLAIAELYRDDDPEDTAAGTGAPPAPDPAPKASRKPAVKKV